MILFYEIIGHKYIAINIILPAIFICPAGHETIFCVVRHVSFGLNSALSSNVSGVLTSPKTKRSKRKVDLSPTLVRELKAHLLAIGTRDATAPIFTSVDGNPIDPDNFYHREFVPALQRAKLQRVGFHSLRHTNVSFRIEQGQSILYISRQIGHSSAKTTLDIYGHLFKEVNSEQAEKLDAILGFSEQPGNLSDSCGRLWKVSAQIKEKGIADKLQPLDLVGSGGRI